MILVEWLQPCRSKSETLAAKSSPSKDLPRRKSDDLFLKAKQADELRKDAVTQLVEPLDVLWCFQVNALGIDLAAESDDFLPVFTHFKPAMNHRLIDFQMKLKTINVCAIPKSLVGA